MLGAIRQHRRGLVALLLGVPAVVGIWTNYVLPGIPRLPVVCAFHVLAPLFLGFTLASILRTVHGEEKVSAESIYGALCGYLLIGLAFGHLYCLVQTIEAKSFNGSAEFMTQLQHEDRQYFLLAYFSFTTLTSVGYGDITPGRDIARALAVLEALLGQFYIAVLIGELIGKRVAQVLADQPSRARE
jgi:hypothetical protein